MSKQSHIDHGVAMVPHFIDGQCVMSWTVPAGKAIDQHIHVFPHPVFLIEGTVMLEVDGVGHLKTAPDAFVVPAMKRHKITSMTAVKWWCVWPESLGDSVEAIEKAVTA